MIRMPPYLDNCTSVFPRTTRCDGQAIYHYPAPITRRFFYAVIRWGWVIVPAVLLALVLTGCDDLDGQPAPSRPTLSRVLNGHARSDSEALQIERARQTIARLLGMDVEELFPDDEKEFDYSEAA